MLRTLSGIRVGPSLGAKVFFRTFKVPSNYKPASPIKQLPFMELCKIWYKSLNSNRLKEMQDELVKFMVDPTLKENHGINLKNEQIRIEDNIYINEINFEINNNADRPTKHLVFIHGYGASLGCFARNFQIVNKFKGMNYNYKVHFLDNISFGLSSNPRIDSNLIDYWKIPKCPQVELNDPEPTNTKNLHNKYYKLVKSFQLSPVEFIEYQEKFTPIMEQIEGYYLDAIEKWRKSRNIDKIDYLIGHSYGGYWSASYACSKYSANLKNLILLSPVGVERHIHAITNNESYLSDAKKAGKSGKIELEPTLDPSSFNFLTRLPILPEKTIKNWYRLQPFLPRLLKFLGPIGVSKYYKMWYMKLFKINNLINKNGGPEILFTSNNDLNYGSNRECQLIIEYLYNSITNGTFSDIYIKYLLTPCTVSKVPLFDKFTKFFNTKGEQGASKDLKIHFLYGQFDFMNYEAGNKLVKQINQSSNKELAKFYSISEGGHNLYIDNPFETNALIHDIVRDDD